MCIRDSFNTKDVILLDDSLAFPNGINISPIDGKLYVCESCLLYTSDAADERSSVDLGGRRIIKKKQSKDTGGMVITTKIH